nr:glycosyltransferase family 39 protein [Thiorhodococcus minor]
MTLWRLVVAGFLPVTQDEAYYFDWARSLAWGYFDHPPGVALLGVGGLLEPGSALMARLGGVLAGMLTLLILARLYVNSGLGQGGVVALALALAFGTLPGLAGGVILTPDSALALAWALALHEAERALAVDRRRWITAGVAVGLGLLGKYTMVLIGPVFLWAILWADWRALRTPWPYLGGLAALLVFSPNLVWNAQHDWVSLGFQFGHGFSTEAPGFVAPEAGAIDHAGPQSAAERLWSLAGYAGTQLGLWGGILVALLAPLWSRSGAIKATSADAKPLLTRPARALLIAAAAFPLIFFALVSWGSEVEANWPAMYLMAAAPLVALWLHPVRAWAAAGVGVNLLLVSLYAFHAATDALPLPDSQNRILRETHGFEALARIAAGLDAPVYADRYQTTAMLRFYQPDLETSQWPGLTRPSEYLRGRIAPRVAPKAVTTPFWLVTRFGAPPEIPGFLPQRQRLLFDCPRAPLTEGAEPPCRRPLHSWRLYLYLPE